MSLFHTLIRIMFAHLPCILLLLDPRRKSCSCPLRRVLARFLLVCFFYFSSFFFANWDQYLNTTHITLKGPSDGDGACNLAVRNDARTQHVFQNLSGWPVCTESSIIYSERYWCTQKSIRRSSSWEQLYKIHWAKSVQEDPQSDRSYKLGSLQLGEGLTEDRGPMTVSMRKTSENRRRSLVSKIRYYMSSGTIWVCLRFSP